MTWKRKAKRETPNLRLILAECRREPDEEHPTLAFGFSGPATEKHPRGRGYVCVTLTAYEMTWVEHDVRSIISAADEYCNGFGSLIREFLKGLPGESWAV